MDHTTMNLKYLILLADCRELSNGDLGIDATLLVCWGIVLCVFLLYRGSNPAVSY